MPNLSGRCLCGQVRFSTTSVETNHHACHCSMCRRWAGGPVFAAKVEGVEFEGRDHIKTFRSSDWAERGFCGECGSNLFYRLVEADLYLLSVGAFDDSSAFKLTGEIYIDHKPDSYGFSGDLPKMTEAEFLAMFMSPGES